MLNARETIQRLSRGGALMLLAGGLALAIPATGATEENNALDPNDETAEATEIRRGLPTTDAQRTREQIYYENVISKIEPDLLGHKDRLDLYIGLYKREMINDTNLFATSLKAEWDEQEEKVRLSGYVNYNENHNGLLRLFHHLGFEEVIDEVEVLPSANLGEQKFGIVTAATAFTYGAPEPPRESLTEALMGDPVYLLRDAGNGYFLCLSHEGYVGYISEENIARMDAGRFTEYQQGEQAFFQRNHDVGDRMIPMGARIKVSGHADAGESVLLEMPEGTEVRVPADAVVTRVSRPHPKALEAIRVAEQMYGTRYVWAGKSTEGVDCSGLVQTAFRSQGVNMPRDSYMQAYVGALVGTYHYREEMREGDLLFFLGHQGRITHVAIYKGNDVYLEASRGRVRLTSFNPEDERYDASRAASFAFAKRPLE